MSGQMSKRACAFPFKRPNGTTRTRVLLGFYALQRERVFLRWDAAAEHGVHQPMPPRSAT